MKILKIFCFAPFQKDLAIFAFSCYLSHFSFTIFQCFLPTAHLTILSCAQVRGCVYRCHGDVMATRIVQWERTRKTVVRRSRSLIPPFRTAAEIWWINTLIHKNPFIFLSTSYSPDKFKKTSFVIKRYKHFLLLLTCKWNFDLKS